MKRKKQDVFELTIEERKQMAEHLYVVYPRTKAILNEIAYCHQHAKTAAEPEGMLLEGPAGMGKTTLWKYYMRNFPRKITEDGTIVPILAVKIEVPASPKSLVTVLLRALGDPLPEKGTTVSQTLRLYSFIQNCKIELVFLDEFQHFIDRDSKKVLKTISDWLKNLMDNTGKPIILIGMPYSHSILDAEGNEQLRRRFSKRFNIEPFRWKNLDDRKDFRRFLQAVDEKLPLKEWSNLSDTTTAFRFYLASDGVISKVMKLIRRATVIALDLSLDMLNLDILSFAYDECLAANDPDKENPFGYGAMKSEPKHATRNKYKLRATNSRSKAKGKELKASDIL
jgi:predicted AAA+ superfamily ATPase